MLRSWPTHLYKWLEDTFLILRGYAGAGVLNLKPQEHTITGMFGQAIHPRVTLPSSVNFNALPIKLTSMCRSMEASVRTR